MLSIYKTSLMLNLTKSIKYISFLAISFVVVILIYINTLVAQIDTFIYIKSGDNISVVVNHLQNNGMKNVFAIELMAKVAIRIFGFSVKTGEYKIRPNQTLLSICENIFHGNTYVRKITIPEGYTAWNIMKLLNDNEYLSGPMIKDLKDGIVMPETYEFSRGYDRSKLLQQMIESMEIFLDKQWAMRDSSVNLKNKYEALIFASIVEREAALSSERAHIASVFYNRLKIGMKLESCATATYGMTMGRGHVTRVLNAKDIASNTIYNTYIINGLPPTPIASPGKEAIIATLHPMQSNDLFFVRDVNSRYGHIFSKTVEEHEKHGAIYRKWSRGKS